MADAAAVQKGAADEAEVVDNEAARLDRSWHIKAGKVSWCSRYSVAYAGGVKVVAHDVARIAEADGRESASRRGS